MKFLKKSLHPFGLIQVSLLQRFQNFLSKHSDSQDHCLKLAVKVGGSVLSAVFLKWLAVRSFY